MKCLLRLKNFMNYTSFNTRRTNKTFCLTFQIILLVGTPKPLQRNLKFLKIQNFSCRNCLKTFVKSAIPSNLQSLIIARLANDVLLEWIITVHGSITVLESKTRSIFSCSWSMYLLDQFTPLSSLYGADLTVFPKNVKFIKITCSTCF